MDETPKSGRAKRTWRRVGWGALIALGVLVTIVAVALWLGPPRDPKCFALDDEDFGLGFRVGDPWAPDAFEAAMKANGLAVTRDEGIPDSKLVSALWLGNHGLLTIQACATSGKDEAYVNMVILSVCRPYDPDEQEAAVPNRGIAAIVAGALYQAITTSANVKFGIDESTLTEAYGKPLVRCQPNDWANGPCFVYAGDHQLISFRFLDGRLDTIVASSPNRDSAYLNRLIAWIIYLGSPIMECIQNRQQRSSPSFTHEKE